MLSAEDVVKCLKVSVYALTTTVKVFKIKVMLMNNFFSKQKKQLQVLKKMYILLQYI